MLKTTEHSLPAGLQSARTGIGSRLRLREKAGLLDGLEAQVGSRLLPIKILLAKSVKVHVAHVTENEIRVNHIRRSRCTIPNKIIFFFFAGIVDHKGMEDSCSIKNSRDCSDWLN